MGDTALERDDRPRPLVEHPEAKWSEMHEPQAIVYSAQADDLAEALIRQVVGKIRNQGNVEADRLREGIRRAIAVLQATVG